MKKSKTKRIGITEYCVYCGKEAKECIEWDEYDRSLTYYCDCEYGKKEQQANKILEELKEVERNTRIQVLYDLEYEDELHRLKLKYGKNDG